MTPYEFLLSQPGLRGLSLDCDDMTIDVGGKSLHVAKDTKVFITPVPGKIKVDLSPEPRLDVGWGVKAPLRFEVLEDGVFGIGSKLGITKRQRLVFAEVGDE